MNRDRTQAFFEAKNTDRRAARQADPVAFVNGRRNRSELARGGAFGHEDAWINNQCIMGTIHGRSKSDKRED